MGTDISAPYAFRFSTAGLSGPVVVTLRAADRAGNVTTVRRTIVVDNLAPAVAVAHSGRYVTGRATDKSGISRLELVVDGRVAARFSGYLRQFKLPAGRHLIQVRAYDKAGNARVVTAGKLAG